MGAPNDGRTATSPNTGSDSDPIFVCFANAAIPAGSKAYYEITVKNAALYTAFGVGWFHERVCEMGHLTDGSQWQGTVGQPPPNPSHFIVFSYNGGVQEESVYLQQFDQVNRPNPVFWTNPDVIGIAVDTVAKTVQFTLKDSIANSLTNSRTTAHQPGGAWTGPCLPNQRRRSPALPIRVELEDASASIATINGGSCSVCDGRSAWFHSSRHASQRPGVSAQRSHWRTCRTAHRDLLAGRGRAVRVQLASAAGRLNCVGVTEAMRDAQIAKCLTRIASATPSLSCSGRGITPSPDGAT